MGRSPERGPGPAGATVGDRVLSDEGADRELRERGVTVLPCLSDDEVSRVLDDYWRLVPPEDHGLAIDHMRPDRAVVRQLRDLAVSALEPRLEELCPDVRVVMATFVTKHPGPASEMFLHDDRSYVDERRFRACTLWVPLCDVGPGLRNGGLQVVPGSHRLPTGWSGSCTPDLIRPWESALRAGLETVQARAGSAVVYDTRLLHASPANLTEVPRVALVCAVAPRSARLIHVVATSRRRRRLHAVDESFFVDNHPHDVERSMPDRWPVLEELDDDAIVRAVDVEAVTGTAPPPPSVVVPDDVRRPDDPRPLPGLAGPPAVSPLSDSDVEVQVGDLRPDTAAVPVLARTGRPAGGWAPLVTRFRPRPRPVPDAREWRRLVAGGPARDMELHVLEPGDRVEVTAPRTPRWSTELDVVEAPPVGAGIRTGAAASQLEVGTRLELPQGELMVLWNDGPGQLVVLAARVADRSDPVGRVLVAVDRRRRRGRAER